jgi:hypothetical protein
MSEALKQLSDKLMTTQRPDDCNSSVNLLDSIPIITCSGKRYGIVAKEITDKTFCSTKGNWCYGLKLYVLGVFRPSKLPFPESVVITQASENDLNAFKQNWADLSNRKFYSDKIYHDTEFFVNMAKEIHSTMLTPVNGVKGQPDYIKFFDKVAIDLYSRAVPTVRQPIEAFFNWINEKQIFKERQTLDQLMGC